MPRKRQLHRRSRGVGHVRKSAHNRGAAIACLKLTNAAEATFNLASRRICQPVLRGEGRKDRREAPTSARADLRTPAHGPHCPGAWIMRQSRCRPIRATRNEHNRNGNHLQNVPSVIHDYATQVQSGKVFEYTAGNFDSVKLLKPFLANITRGEIRLTNRIDIQIRTASYKTIRGITSPLVVLDELAFFDLEGSANPDKQIYDAVVPSLASLHGQLAVISSPFGKRGLLWDTYRENYGPDGDPQILVAKASTRQLNSTIDQRIIDRAVKKDPSQPGPNGSENSATISRPSSAATSSNPRHPRPDRTPARRPRPRRIL